MPITLSEADVRSLVDMPLALEAVEVAFRSLGSGHGRTVPRERLFPPLATGARTSLQVMAATVPELDAMGLKAYGTGAGGASFVVLVFRASTGELRGIVGADWLGRYRTGAASGVASRYLARPESTTLGVLGAGGQAVTQVLAIAAALPGIRHVRAWNRSADRASSFEARLRELGGASLDGMVVEPVGSAREAVTGADVVVTITSSSTPVLEGAWLGDGTHVNAAGINRANVAEIDAAAVARAEVVVVDHLDNARREAGDLVLAAAAGHFAWERAVELGAIMTGAHPGRTSATQVTLFESQGIAAEDVALGALLLDRAAAAGVGGRADLAG